jgi:DnaK suppressor protein
MPAMAVLIDVEARERKELEEIAASRARLRQGTFGICEACGGRIPLVRLEAVPAARYCLVCQAKAEEGEATVPPDAR